MKLKLITLALALSLFMGGCRVFSCQATADFQYGSGFQVRSCTLIYDDGANWPTFRLLNLPRMAK